MTNLFPAHLENRFTKRAKNAINSLYSKNGEAHTVHLLYALACESGSLSKNILQAHSITSTDIARAIPASDRKKRALSLNKDLKTIIKRATRISLKHSQPYIGTEHLLYAIISNKETSASLNKIGGGETQKKITKIKKHLDKILSQNINTPFFPDIFKKNKSRKIVKSTTSISKRAWQNKSKEQEHHHYHHREPSTSKTPALDTFCENLTELAQEKILDPVVGREKEIARIIYILSRRTKNNPLLIGEPGVGKTAIIQGLAQKISNGEVPSLLLHKNIFSLNLNSLVAGTMFRGDFETRIQDILSESSRGDIILFMDEIHTVIGAGAASGSLDVANILKPALSSGIIQCIGATTLDEYRKYIERERALERRFQTVVIGEETYLVCNRTQGLPPKQ